MKQLFPLVIIVLIFLSCTEDEEEVVAADVFGTYQLKEILSDPGDGSGEFSAVESDRRITLHEDSTFQTNFTFCNPLSAENSGNDNGTFSSNLLYFNTDCEINIPFNTLSIELSPEKLIISYPCIEACAEKYSRID